MDHSRVRPPAAESYAPTFADLDTVLRQLHEWIDRTPVPDEASHYGVVTLGILVRATNQLRAIVTLLKANFWEDALILTRALFELLLNTEELVHRCPDREQGAARLLLFWQLQTYLEWTRLQEYQIASGRAGSTLRDELAQMDKPARKLFAPFAFTDKKGRPKWRVSWCNRNVAELCTASPNPMRQHQHRILYASGSDFAHSTPLALMSTSRLYRSPEWETFLHDSTVAEEHGLRRVASFALVFLGEIFALVGTRVPAYRPEWVADTLGAIIRRIVEAPGEKGRAV